MAECPITSPAAFVGPDLMQPLYQMPGDLFAAHVARLQGCPRVADCSPRLHALLFLSGLRMAVHYCRAARGGNEFLTNYAPAHHLDDGLTTAGKRALAELARLARSREVRDDLAAACGGPAPKFAAVCIAFAELFEHCSPSVRQWITLGNSEENRVRLSFAMGVQSLWLWKPPRYVLQMTREPLGLDPAEFAALDAFKLAAETTLPEL